ncbi:hypothetical protein LAZ67_5003814 [Cordylochernes scorpioides]|uniref:Transposase n=1 Tax=Cordylochernes scorpioides TaxID=51811 RepID=A0ABY6KKM6_9ARAC|nr:hypothetical protein LAZ67_5003814 [Cordylochernes scorpioides]
MSSVRYWFNDFERGRTSVFDEDHPTDLITEEILEKVHDIILSDRGMKVGEVTAAIESAPTKGKMVPSARKVMTVNKLRKRHFLIVQIKVADDLRHQLLLVTRSGNAFFLKEKNVYYENAPAHSSGVVATKLKELRYEFVPNPLYSPILAPCDFYLFTHMKRWLAGEKFGFNEEIISCKKMYFVDLDNCLFGRAEKRQGR